MTMTYRTPNPDRLYVCPRCGAPERAPFQGGNVACRYCQTPHVLPDRSAWPANPLALQMPPDDPARIQHLRAQDGRPHQVTPTLQAVLGGTSVQLGREQEALAIWQSLRARSQQGDVAASEDLATLTLILVQMPATSPELGEALSESACDAAVLPRHRQDMLGRLSRRAAGHGDRARAQQYLAWMAPWSHELDMDSELRVSAAVLATLDRDAQRVLALLGPRKDAIPIVDAMDALASVLRANAYELFGNLPAAAQVLRELPEPRLLALVNGSFPALRLCAAAGPAYAAATTQEAAQRAASSAGNVGSLLGGTFAFTGLVCLAVGVFGRHRLGFAVIGAVILVYGIFGVVRARAKGKRAAWLRANGVSLTARITGAQLTGTRINNVPIFRFALQVAGPQGPYAASFEKLVPEHQAATLIGGEVRVRADPGNLQEVIPED
jgi:hypothetical protein